jgi:hypothetical protein
VERVALNAFNALPNQMRLAANFRLWTPIGASSYSDRCLWRASGLLALPFVA